MASLERVKARIQKMANGTRKNVTISDIEWVVNHLEVNGFKTTQKNAPHGTLFQIESQTFNVCTHNPGNSQIKICYVNEFLTAMMELGLYED